MKTSSDTQSGPLVYYLTAAFMGGLVAAACALVWYGWQLVASASTWFPAHLAWLPAAIMAAVAVILLPLIILEKEGQKMNGRIAGLVLCLVLISGVGLLNTLFFKNEGGLIVTEAAEQATVALGQLHLAAAKALATPQYDATVLAVHGLMNSFQREMLNEANCGEGPAARAVLGRIVELLPTMVVLSGSVNDCASAARRVGEYRLMADGALAALKKSSPEQVEKKHLVYAAVAHDVTAALSKLDLALQESRQGAYHVGVTALVDVAAMYQKAFGKAQAAGGTPDVPPALDIGRIQRLGALSELPIVVWTRRGDITTWMYMIAAIAFDTLLIVTGSYLLGLYRQRQQKRLEARQLAAAKRAREQQALQQLEEARQRREREFEEQQRIELARAAEERAVQEKELADQQRLQAIEAARQPEFFWKRDGRKRRR